VSALAAFGFAAALIAVMGLHGLAAYGVNARTGEIAVRKALGARSRHILAMTGGPLLLIVAAGLVTGLLGALPLTRALASQLWGVTPTNPAAFVAVAVVLLSATMLGCLVPLRRAQAVDPAARLRSE
jgi:ABC-type antimicrobial peptide transport system permease subunit